MLQIQCLLDFWLNNSLVTSPLPLNLWFVNFKFPIISTYAIPSGYRSVANTNPSSESHFWILNSLPFQGKVTPWDSLYSTAGLTYRWFSGALWVVDWSFSCKCTSQGVTEARVHWMTQSTSNCYDDCTAARESMSPLPAQPGPLSSIPIPSQVSCCQPPASLVTVAWESPGCCPCSRGIENKNTAQVLPFFPMFPLHPALPSYFPFLLLPLPPHYLQGKE